jgi:hypothetical protein
MNVLRFGRVLSITVQTLPFILISGNLSALHPASYRVQQLLFRLPTPADFWQEWGAGLPHSGIY